jgi:hypothetical protein
MWLKKVWVMAVTVGVDDALKVSAAAQARQPLTVAHFHRAESPPLCQ